MVYFTHFLLSRYLNLSCVQFNIITKDFANCKWTKYTYTLLVNFRVILLNLNLPIASLWSLNFELSLSPHDQWHCIEVCHMLSQRIWLLSDKCAKSMFQGQNLRLIRNTVIWQLFLIHLYLFTFGKTGHFRIPQLYFNILTADFSTGRLTFRVMCATPTSSGSVLKLNRSVQKWLC